MDLVVDLGDRLVLTEAKSGATMQPTFLRHLRRLAEWVEDQPQRRGLDLRIVYGGDRSQQRSDATVLAWSEMLDRRW